MNARLASSSRNRRGVAIVVVLVVISITFALSYAIMRSQGASLLIQHNAGLQASARQAAETGLQAAIQRMHTARWEGVDTTLSGSPGQHLSFEVSYAAGDASLSAADADYREYPYRVTLLATGRAADPDNPARTVAHRIRAVVRLVPRKLADTPADWSTMQDYTVFQSRKDQFEVDIPCRLSGRVRVQGRLKIAPSYPNDANAWWRYLRDLNLMRSGGYPDYRPFSGPVDLPFVEQEAKCLWALAGQLAVTANDVPVKEAGADWTNPALPMTYQLYPGGPAYAIPRLPDRLEGAACEPDPLANPLGALYREGTLELRSGVSIRGCLVCRDDISVTGTGVLVKPVELPPLAGQSSPVRLAGTGCRSFLVRASGGGQVTGLLAAFDRFQVDKSQETAQFAVTGRVIARRVYIMERQPWETLDWKALYNQYMLELSLPLIPTTPYFPVWMKARGRDPAPRVTIAPDASPAAYHWPRWDKPIFVPHPDDATALDPTRPGLRWELVEWTDSP